jgi:ABC-type lipoprotein export system ATPase subunit
MLRLEQISKRFKRPDGEKVALDNVSLSLDRGEIAGIFGPSGSGKTTLLKIAAGLERADSGTVSYDGEALRSMSRKDRQRLRRRELGCVWARQEWEDGMTILEWVRVPLALDRWSSRRATHRAHEVLLACEAEQCEKLHPRELSDGERQRVAIARALVADPRLLLVDGPASHLAPEEQEQIMLLLASLAREGSVAVLVTDNNEETLLRADPVFYLCDGKLVTPKPRTGRGEVLSFPTARSRRAAADA